MISIILFCVPVISPQIILYKTMLCIGKIKLKPNREVYPPFPPPLHTLLPSW